MKLSVQTHQSGFVLMAVLVALLLLSAMAAMLIHQSGSDTRVGFTLQRSTSLSQHSHAAAMSLWRMNQEQLDELTTAPSSWLSRLKVANQTNESQLILVLQRCHRDDHGQIGSVQQDRDSIDAACQAGSDKLYQQEFIYWQPVDQTHYAVTMQARQAAQTDTQMRYYLLTYYMMAAPDDRELMACRGLSMAEHQRLRCLSQLGIPVVVNAIEWLISEPLITSDASQMPQTPPTPDAITVTKLRYYELKLPRE